jgi:hypothetical protein
MIPVLPGRLIIAVRVLATILTLPARAAEKLSWHPKLVHRQLGAGYTLALELERRDKTFFVCRPGKTDCISVTAIGWRKPFILYRAGIGGTSVSVCDTTGVRHSESPNYLKTVSLYPAAVAWEKLSPTKALW